jgi:hypothetical protein
MIKHTRACMHTFSYDDPKPYIHMHTEECDCIHTYTHVYAFHILPQDQASYLTSFQWLLLRHQQELTLFLNE